MRARLLISCTLLLAAACAPAATPPATTPPAAVATQAPASRAAPTAARAATAQPTAGTALTAQAAPTVAATLTPPAAPTAKPAPTAKATAAGDLLWALESEEHPRLAIVDAASGARLRELPLGVVSPDWSTLYSVEHDGTSPDSATWTVLRAIDPQSGATLRQTARLDGRYDLPFGGIGLGVAGLSPDGRWLALQVNRTEREDRAAQRDNRWKSQLLVIDTAFARPPKRIDLDGEFAFDALGNGGDSLYLTEYPSPGQGAQQKIRRFDLASMALDPQVVVNKGEPPGSSMGGMRLAAIPSRDGTWLYSLYIGETSGPFIHALNLTDHIAICIDLPDTNKEDLEHGLLWSMAVTPDGATAYAVNGALRLAAEVDLRDLRVRRTATLKVPAAAAAAGGLEQVARWLLPTAEAKRILHGGLAISKDGRRLYSIDEQGLLQIDSRDLTVRGRTLDTYALDSLATSADGERLYAVSGERGQILELDPAQGTLVREVKGSNSPWGILRVAPTE